MNKNKLVFLILWIWIVIIIFVLVSYLSNSSKNKVTTSTNALNIWILKDDVNKFNDFLKTFNSSNKNYANAKFNVVSFDNYWEYFVSLIWSFLSWKSPDIFVLNNSEWNFFDSQIVWIDPNDIKVDEFRKNYEMVFSNDLISSIDNWWQKIEYLKWVPLWYESLGLFYNFLYLRWKKLDTWSYVNDVITELKTNNWVQTVLWLWNWSTVYDAADIITQFFLLDNKKSLKEADSTSVKNALSSYFKFWDINWENWYNYFLEDLKSNSKNNLDLFSSWDLQIVVWYPRMLSEIDKKWFNKSFLRASSFPSYTDKVWKVMVNYNYFVINKNTKDMPLSVELLKYFATSQWQKAYLDRFSFYLPSNLTLTKSRLDQNVMTWYYVKYKDFYNPNLELTTFNKWYKTFFDSEVPNILDNWLIWVELFENLKKRLLCLSNKMISQDNLWVACK